MKKDSRIFVSGHAGLIGSAMVHQLHKAGYRNIVTRTRAELDLRDSSKVLQFFETIRPEYVILAAGKVGGIVENQTYPADFMDENVAIQLNVLRAARHVDVKKLILFGSSCMYPRECPQPMSEDVLLSGKPEPTSISYAIAKLAGIYMCLAYNKQYGEKRFIPVIPNSAYGPNDNFNPESGHVLAALLSRFHQAKLKNSPTVTLWGSGSPCREFVYTSDIADACIYLLENNIADLELPVNIGIGTDVSIKELAEKIAIITGYTGKLIWDTNKPDGAPRKLLDCSRLQDFGWKSIVSFDDGLLDTYNWYKQNISTTLTEAS